MPVSRARTSVLRGLVRAWGVSEADYFSRSYGLLAKFDRNLSSWKMSQGSLLVEDGELPPPYPRYGMIVDGECYPLMIWERRILERDGFAWPTPTIHGNNNRKGASKTSGDGLATAVKLWPSPQSRDYRIGQAKRVGRIGYQNNLNDVVTILPTPTARDRWTRGKAEAFRRSPCLDHIAGEGIGGKLNPMWVEWLMGFPIGWTELNAWATQWFRAKRGKRLKD